MTDGARIERLCRPTATRLRSSLVIPSLPQVLTELAHNALDAGATRVECWVNLVPGDESVRLEDDGYGIGLENLGIVGERYSESRFWALVIRSSHLPSNSRNKQGDGGMVRQRRVRVPRRGARVHRCPLVNGDNVARGRRRDAFEDHPRELTRYRDELTSERPDDLPRQGAARPRPRAGHHRLRARPLQRDPRAPHVARCGSHLVPQRVPAGGGGARPRRARGQVDAVGGQAQRHAQGPALGRGELWRYPRS